MITIEYSMCPHPEDEVQAGGRAFKNITLKARITPQARLYVEIWGKEVESHKIVRVDNWSYSPNMDRAILEHDALKVNMAWIFRWLSRGDIGGQSLDEAMFFILRQYYFKTEQFKGWFPKYTNFMERNKQ